MNVHMLDQSLVSRKQITLKTDITSLPHTIEGVFE